MVNILMVKYLSGSSGLNVATYNAETTKQWSKCGYLQCRDNKGGLTLKEIWDLTEGNRNIMDPTGWVAEKLEWFVTYYLFADDDVSLSIIPCLAYLYSRLLYSCVSSVKRSFVSDS